MPEQLPLVVDNQAYLLASELIDECVVENISLAQIAKYSLLAVASLAPTAAAPAAGAYTADELTSDALKCVAKAFVDASLDLTPAQKETYKSRIGTVFTLKDWRSFSQNIKELRDPNEVKRTKAALETAAAAIERTLEGVDLARAIGEVIAGGRDEASNYVFGEAETDLDAYDYATRYCRYEDAEKRLNEAKDAAARECRGYGDRYRQAELSLRNHIYRFRPVLTDALTDPLKAAVSRNAAEDVYVSLHNTLQFRKSQLERYMEIFDRLKEEDRRLSRARDDFRNQQSDYKHQVRLIRRVLSASDVCEDISELRQMAAAVKPECRAAFFANADPGEMASIADLGLELADYARQKSAEWWAKSDEVHTDFRACRLDAAKTALAALRAEINSHPLSLMKNDTCEQVSQSTLLQRLDGLSAPSYCFERPVPEVRGLSYDAAVEELYYAGLQPADQIRSAAAKAGQKPGTVVEADPVVGTMQKAGTKVALTVAKAEPAEETATMPDVIGVDSAVAAERVGKANLIPQVIDDKPADKREYEPGTVYAASAGKGDRLPVKTEVILNAYGPRPKVVIPRVAGMMPIVAKGVLLAKNFTVGDPVPGEPATGSQVPGDIYGTTPPEGSEQDMFGEVTILVYAEPEEPTAEMRPIPSVIGQTVKAAAGVLAGPDEFFSVGTVYLGPPAPADKKPGTVALMIPGPETTAARGTKVDLEVYGPHAAEPAPDQPPAPPVEPDVAADEGGWLGRWRIHGVVDRDGKRQIIDAIMEIGPGDAGLALSLFHLKEGQYKKTISIPVRIVDGALTVPVDVLQQRQQGSSQDSSALFAQQFAKLGDMIRQLLETLRITREGTQCRLTFVEKNVQQVIPFECVRDQAGQQ